MGWTDQDEQEYQAIKAQAAQLMGQNQPSENAEKTPDSLEARKDKLREYLKPGGEFEVSMKSMPLPVPVPSLGGIGVSGAVRQLAIPSAIVGAEEAGRSAQKEGASYPQELGQRLRGGVTSGLTGLILGKGIEKVVGGGQSLLGKMSGLGRGDTAHYAKVGKQIEDLANQRVVAPDEFERGLKDEVGKAQKAAWEYTNALQSQKAGKLVGKSLAVDINATRKAGPNTDKEIEQLLLKRGLPEGEVSKVVLTGPEHSRLQKAVQSDAEYQMSQAVSVPSAKAKSKDAAKIYKNLGKAEESVAPEISKINEELAANTRAAKLANKAAVKPERILREGVGVDAVKARLDKVTGGEFGQNIKSYQVANKIAKSAERPPSGISGAVQQAGAPITRAGIRAAEKIKEPSAKGISQLLSPGAERATSPEAAPQWSPQDEQEYQEIKSQAMEMQRKPK